MQWGHSSIYAFGPVLFQIPEEDKCSKVPPASGNMVGYYSSRAMLELRQNGIVEIQAGAQ